MASSIIQEPFFYIVAIPVLIMFGISKGGFGGALGTLAVPILSFVIPITQAAAIILPILCVMDIINLVIYRKNFSIPLLKILLLPALLGIAIASFFFYYFEAHWVKLILALFCLFIVWQRIFQKYVHNKKPSLYKGIFWSSIAGFTSTIAHAGGPPINMYLLPLRLAPKIFVGTTAYLFFFINYVKLLPYFYLGLFNNANLTTSLFLLPAAPIGILLGYTLVSYISKDLFYNITYTLLFLSGIKFLYDSIVYFAGQIA